MKLKPKDLIAAALEGEFKTQPVDDGIFQGNTQILTLAAIKRYDLLQSLLIDNPKANVDLNAALKHENHLKRGITLSWLLASRKKYDLFQFLLEHNPNAVVDLDASPTHDKHPSNNITLAWLLVSHKQYDLIQNLLERNPNATLDLNATLRLESDSIKRVTLAWWLAYEEKYDLLQTLFERNSNISVDLNAMPLENSDEKGITLAWMLACNHRYDLFQEILRRDPSVAVDLNATPQHEDHPAKGITLIWLLAAHRRFTLLNELLTNNSTMKFSLQAKLDNRSSLFNLLLTAPFSDIIQSIFSKILNAYTNEEIIEFIHICRNEFHPEFYDFLFQQIDARNSEILISEIIKKYDGEEGCVKLADRLKITMVDRLDPTELSNKSTNLTDGIKDTLSYVIGLLKSIKSSSSFYQIARYKLGKLVTEIAKNKEIAHWAFDHHFRQEFSRLKMNSLTQLTTDADKLRVIRQHFLYSGGRRGRRLALRFFTGKLRTIDELRKSDRSSFRKRKRPRSIDSNKRKENTSRKKKVKLNK